VIFLLILLALIALELNRWRDQLDVSCSARSILCARQKEPLGEERLCRYELAD